MQYMIMIMIMIHGFWGGCQACLYSNIYEFWYETNRLVVNANAWSVA